MFFKEGPSGIGEKEFNERFRRLGVLGVVKSRDHIANGRAMVRGNLIEQLYSISCHGVVGLINDAEDAWDGFNLSYHSANIRRRGDPVGNGFPPAPMLAGKSL